MKIAILGFNDFLNEGRQQRMARSLQKEHTVKVFGVALRPLDYPAIVEGIETEIVPLKSKKLSRHPSVQILKYLEYYARTIVAIHKWKPDAIFTIDPETLLFAALFHLQDIPFVYCANEYHRGTTHLQAYNRILYRMLLLLEGPMMRRAFHSVTVNDSIAFALEHHYGMKRPLLVRNIPDLTFEAVDQPSGEDPLRARANLKPTDKIVLHLGVIMEHRGLHNVIRSVKDWDDNIHFVLLGSGHLIPELKELRDELGLAKRVIFLDPVPQREILAHTRCADAGIVSFERNCRNHYYGLPNKFFQVGLSGIPLLTSFFPEMKRIVDGYRLGGTFDPASPADIAATVNRVIRSGFRVQDEDHRRFCADFNWQNEEKTLLGIFADLEKGLFLR